MIFSLIRFVELNYVFLDLFSWDFFYLVIPCDFYFLMRVVVDHGWVNQIQRARRDKDTQETVQPNRSIFFLFKFRNGGFAPLYVLNFFQGSPGPT